MKNDNEFICQNCSQKVEKLNYTSRDHCNYCLCSLHVDITPGDRLNTCRGMLVPINIEINSKKGEVVVYKCSKCGAIIKNIVAKDDNKEKIYKIIENYSKGI
ncbi:MAG: RNHCP domain-containing protein [Clostridia bacterium]